MNDENLNPYNENVKFTCPVCGEISRDEVIFLCNTCERSELIFKEGIYMCPSCLQPGENFECMNCGSKEVVMSQLAESEEELEFEDEEEFDLDELEDEWDDSADDEE